MIPSTVIRHVGVRLGLAAWLIGGATAAHGALRCGTELVSEGDSVVKLLEACGEPTTGDPSLFLDRTDWVYNFGPEEFLYRVIIPDGDVERIEEPGRGVAEPVEGEEDL